MKYYLVAGEASGDMHGSHLIHYLGIRDPSAEFRCFGGELMEKAGAFLVKNYQEMAYMGFSEVLFHIRTILRNLSFCKSDILGFSPDVLILIDYPGFNLRLAEWAHNKGIRVVYYISPQIWAWKEGRIRIIRKSVDKMIVILPFEQEYYMRHHMEVEYVGHPLLDVIGQQQLIPPQSMVSSRPVIALLPGSRTQEFRIKLPIMLKIVNYFPDYQFVIGIAPGLDEGLIPSIVLDFPNVNLVKGSTYELLKQAKAALVTSGTATLETALFGVPQVVCYKAGALSYFLGRLFVRVKFISLVNLIMGKPVVRELIQGNLTKEKLLAELTLILNNSGVRNRILADYKLLRSRLGDGHASERAANSIHEFIIGAVKPTNL